MGDCVNMCARMCVGGGGGGRMYMCVGGCGYVCVYVCLTGVTYLPLCVCIYNIQIFALKLSPSGRLLKVIIQFNT